MRVMFISDPPADEAKPGLYRKGQVYDLTSVQVERWRRRGRIIDAPPEPAPEPKAKPAKAAAPSAAPAEPAVEPAVELAATDAPPEVAKS